MKMNFPFSLNIFFFGGLFSSIVEFILATTVRSNEMRKKKMYHAITLLGLIKVSFRKQISLSSFLFYGLCCGEMEHKCAYI